MAEEKLLKVGAGASDFAQFDATDTMPGANYPLPNVISPAQITSNQNDYAPTGWADADVVRLNFDTGGRGINGFAAWTNTRPKRLQNTSGNFGYIACEHTGSSAANRVIGICDHIIEPYGTLVLEYDGTSSRVRVVGNSFNPSRVSAFGRGHFYNVSVGATLGSDWGDLGIGISGGGNGQISGTATLPGGWEIHTSSSASGASSLYLAKTVNNPAFLGSAHIVSSIMVYFDTLSDGTNTFTFSHGLIPGANSTTLNVNNSVTIQYTHGTNSGRFYGATRDNTGGQTNTDLGVTVAVDTIYILTVCHNKANGEARFYVNGVLGGIATANMPNGVAVGDRSIIVKSAGTTARNAVIARKSFSTIY